MTTGDTTFIHQCATLYRYVKNASILFFVPATSKHTNNEATLEAQVHPQLAVANTRVPSSWELQ